MWCRGEWRWHDLQRSSQSVLRIPGATSDNTRLTGADGSIIRPEHVVLVQGKSEPYQDAHRSKGASVPEPSSSALYCLFISILGRKVQTASFVYS